MKSGPLTRRDGGQVNSAAPLDNISCLLLLRLRSISPVDLHDREVARTGTGNAGHGANTLRALRDSMATSAKAEQGSRDGRVGLPARQAESRATACSPATIIGARNPLPCTRSTLWRQVSSLTPSRSTVGEAHSELAPNASAKSKWARLRPRAAARSRAHPWCRDKPRLHLARKASANNREPPS